MILAGNDKIAVADKNNGVIGYKFRKELTDDGCWRIILVWIGNDHGQALLQQRSLRAWLPESGHQP